MNVSHTQKRFRKDRDRLAALYRAVDEQAVYHYEEEQKKKHKGGSSKRTYYKQQKLTEIYELAEMMFYNNKSMEEIAHAVNRNMRTIYYWKRKFNWQRNKQFTYTKRPYRRGPKFNYRKQKLQQLYDTAENLFYEYKTYSEIGEAVSRSSRTIQNWKKRFGWKRDKNQRYHVARRLYEEEGWWVKKLHMRLNIPVSTLYTWIRRDNWTQTS